MNSVRTRRWLNVGLFLLTAGVFAAAFILNRNQYATSLSSVETSFQQSLGQQEKNLRQEIEKLEAECFSANADAASAFARFTVLANRVVPACTAGLLETVPGKEADTAFATGIELLPSQKALPFFQLASRRKIETSADLYRKLSAYFNRLELEMNTPNVCCILILLDLDDPILTPSQSVFFRSMLTERVPDLEEIKETLSRQRETAEIIDRKLTRKRGAYRAAIAGQTLSVREDGLALLYSPEAQTIPPVELAHTIPDGLHKEIIPSLFIWIPDPVIEEEKVKIKEQYRMGNAILALMAILGAGLVIGLFAASKRQRELTAMKAEFIATVSHELRTPLSLIRLHAETLHHGRIPPEKVAEYHQTILTESERLSGIVNNVLDFSRMERDKLQLHPEPTDLSALCERIADSFRFRLEKDGFELENAIRPGIVASVDPLAYSQILFNLIDNAIKYSDTEKRIRIELESSKGWNILRVSDHGIGISDRLQKKIFDDFVRSDDRKVTARRGSGIGLSVARRLAEKMKGTIEVGDNEPTGSIFTVKLRNCNESTRG